MFSVLADLYDEDLMDDQFKLSVSPNGKKIVSGIYNNRFHMLDLKGNCNEEFELNFNKKTIIRNIKDNQFNKLSSPYNYKHKVLISDWHPSQNCLAIACANCLFFYNE